MHRDADRPTVPPASPAWVRGTAEASDGIPLAFWSAGDGVPVLFVAGQAVDHHSWDLAAPVLAPGRRLVVFDHRGTGASGSGDADRFTTRNLADDARAVLDAAGVPRAHVVGHSMGGRVAQWLAVDRPGRVDRLVLAATTAGDRHGPSRDPAADKALRSGDSPTLARLFFPDDWDPDAFGRLLSVGRSRDDRARHFRASRNHDCLAELGGVAARTLVLHGTDDLVTSAEHARVLAAQLPNSRLVLLRGARHGIVLDGGLGAQIVHRFLAAADRRGPARTEPGSEVSPPRGTPPS